MTIELSPETDADIRELASLWGFDVGDEYVLESVARGVLNDGLRELIKFRRKWNAEQADTVPQSVPDARGVFVGSNAIPVIAPMAKPVAP